MFKFEFIAVIKDSPVEILLLVSVIFSNIRLYFSAESTVYELEDELT